MKLQRRRQPEAFAGRVEDLIDAHRPEAQTRWEILAALASLGESYGNELSKRLTVQASLFDDTSSTVRLAAFLF